MTKNRSHLYMNLVKLRVLPNIWRSIFFLIVCLSFGLLLALFRNKIFLIWLGLELKMFGIIPLLNSRPSQIKNILFLKRAEIKVSFFYFFVQVVGRLFFAWGRILGDWFIIRIIGLIIKIGAAPFFWWVPSVVSRLDWFSIGIISTIQKVPGILLFRLLFDLELNICILLRLIGFIVSVVGIKFSSNNLKQLIGWSSVRNMSILFVLIILNKRLGLIYYLFYSFLVLIFCRVISLADNNVICSSFLKGKRSNYNKLVMSLLLIFSGLPPFVRFLLKVYFVRGFYLFDCVGMLLDIGLKGNSISFFYLVGSLLQSWNIVMIFIFLIILQAVGYIKAFIKIFSTGSSRLSSRVSLVKKKLKYFILILLINYLLRIILILL